MDKSLPDIADLIRQHDYVAARKALHAYLDQHPEQALAWYMLSFAETDRRKQIAALEQALELDPKSAKFRARLTKLQNAASSQQRFPGRYARGIGIASVIVLLGVLGGIWLVVSRNQSPVASVPTLVVLADVSEPQSPEKTAAVEAVTALPTETNTSVADTATPREATATETEENPINAELATATETPREVFPMAPASKEAIPTRSQNCPPRATLTTGAPGILPTSEATAAPTVTLTDNPPTQPTNVSLIVPNLVAIGTGVDIGNGNLRVIESTRPAHDLMKSLVERAVPAPPANHSWVLVEIHLICNAGDNCVPAPTSFAVKSSAGAYSPAQIFTLTPQFGPDNFLGGQAWGYLNFVVPTDEPTIWLAMQLTGQETVNFALQ